MITQKELAARLGISRTTIARAINNSPNIKLETKEKILKLVKELGYEKNYVGIFERRTFSVYAACSLQTGYRKSRNDA